MLGRGRRRVDAVGDPGRRRGCSSPHRDAEADQHDEEEQVSHDVEGRPDGRAQLDHDPDEHERSGDRGRPAEPARVDVAWPGSRPRASRDRATARSAPEVEVRRSRSTRLRRRPCTPGSPRAPPRPIRPQGPWCSHRPAPRPLRARPRSTISGRPTRAHSFAGPSEKRARHDRHRHDDQDDARDVDEPAPRPGVRSRRWCESPCPCLRPVRARASPRRAERSTPRTAAAAPMRRRCLLFMPPTLGRVGRGRIDEIPEPTAPQAQDSGYPSFPIAVENETIRACRKRC